MRPVASLGATCFILKPVELNLFSNAREVNCISNYTQSVVRDAELQVHPGGVRCVARPKFESRIMVSGAVFCEFPFSDILQSIALLPEQ